MNTQTHVALELIGLLGIGIAYVEARISPRLRALEARLVAAYRKDTTPGERGLISAFIAAAKPLILAQLPGAEQAVLESEAVKRATAYAAAHGIDFTPSEILATVKHEMAGAAAPKPAAEPKAPAAPAAPVAAQVAPAATEAAHVAAPEAAPKS